MDVNNTSLSDLKKEKVYSASLQSTDGGVDHAVTIFNGWIFDSNFPQALPVDKKSFDLCCSTDEIQQSFVKFHKLHTYPHFHKALEDMKPGNPQGKKKRKKKKKCLFYEEMDI